MITARVRNLIKTCVHHLMIQLSKKGILYVWMRVIQLYPENTKWEKKYEFKADDLVFYQYRHHKNKLCCFVSVNVNKCQIKFVIYIEIIRFVEAAECEFAHNCVKFTMNLDWYKISWASNLLQNCLVIFLSNEFGKEKTVDGGVCVGDSFYCSWTNTKRGYMSAKFNN